MMKKILIILIALLVATPAFAAPYFRQEADLVPITDSVHYLGTTTSPLKAWKGIIADLFYDTDADDGCAEWVSNVLTSTGTACGSGGGGSSGGTWSTTTSSVTGQLINYPNNDDDVVSIGDNSTTTAEFWFDPNTSRSLIPYASSTAMTVVSGFFTNLFIGADTLAEYISDTAGAMWTGNTETGGALTYQDADNTIDFVCATASGSVFGCLSATDWTTFNNKQATITDGDGLTFSGATLNFDGGNAPGGELGGTWASPTIDDSLAVTSWNLTTPTFTTNFTFDSVTVTGLSGADVTVLTGTAGTSGNCAEWNADGDLVDAGDPCGTGSGGAGNSKWATSTADTGAIHTASANKVGIGTTSPFSTLSVSTTSANALNLPLLTVASSTHQSLFQVLSGGTVKVGGGTSNLTFDGTDGDISWNGELLPDGDTCSDGEILKKTGANDWDCAADNAAAGDGAFAWTTESFSGTTVNSTSTPIWFTATTPYSTIASSTLTSATTTTGYLQSGDTAIGNNIVKISPSAILDESASESVGGLLNVTTLTSDEIGAVFYNNHTGSNRLLSLVCDAATYSGNCLHVRSDGTATALNVAGAPTGQGLLKLGANGAGDADASMISIDASTSGFLGQAMFMKCGTNSTCWNLRDASNNQVLTVSDVGRYGWGTTTPRYQVQVASSTGPQIALSSADATSPRFTFRAVGDNFYFATSSPATFATSTTPIFSVNSTNTVTFGNANATCIALTGSADLCDGDDATGAGGADFGKTLELVSGGDFLSATSSPYKSFVVGATTTASLNKAALFQVNATGTTGDLIVASSTTSFAGNFAKFNGPDGTNAFQVNNLGAVASAGGFFPTLNDGAALGNSLLGFSDLFVASGAVLNFDDGDVTLTHGSDLLTLDGGGFTATAGTATFGTLAGALDAGGATSFEIPNGTGPTVNATGEVAVDTTSDQIVYFGGTTKRVIQPFDNLGFSYATTTWTASTTDNLIGPAPANITVYSALCEANTGTFGVSLHDGTNRADYIPTASTTINEFLFTSNNTFTKGETMRVDMGTPVSSPTKGSCRFLFTYDAT